jgi:hypothetical protein
LLYIHLITTRPVGFCQLTHIWKAFLSSFVVASIILSYILAFSLIWRPRKRVVGTLPPLNRFFSGQSMIDPGSTFLFSHMLPSPKYNSNFQMQNSSRSTLTYVFLAQWDMPLEESFAEEV